LAAFYLVSAVLFLLASGSPAIAGLLIGLAYLSHPYAIAFIIAFAAATVLELVRQMVLPAWRPIMGLALSNRNLLTAWITIVLVILPWHLWTRLVLQIPSDLLSQNFGSAENAWSFVYPRLVNIATAVLPLFLLPETWASGELRGTMLVNLVSALGVVPLLFLPWALLRTARELPLLAVWLCTVSGLILVGVFGDIGLRPLLHGWQSVWPGLLTLTLLAMSRQFGPNAVLIACWTQLPMNLAYLIAYGHNVYRGV
jgi:hypothetical protein